MKTIVQILLLAFLLAPTAQAEVLKTNVFDHGRWSVLLKAHVYPIRGGKAAVVDYEGMKVDRQELRQYLDALSSVTKTHFDQWSTPDQLAFLINAYNAWTVELILTAWPELKSIRDLGGFLSSPWSKKYAVLLGKTRTLDDIEHKLIRGSDRYKDPRIHFAVNCASISCPALRSEAYIGSRLDQQLDEQTSLFLGDRTRNRAESDSIKLSSIFKWYREDFEKGWQGFNHLEEFLLAHANALGLSATEGEKLQAGDANIEFLEYDWRLNAK